MSDAQTLNDAVQSANTDLTAKHESGDSKVTKSEPRESRKSEKPERTERPEKVERVETREPVADEDDTDFGQPGWTKQWKKSSRSALRKLAQYEGANDLLPELYKEIETRYDYTGKTQAEFERFRKRYEPYDQVLGSLEQRFAMQGMHPAAGLQQMAAVSDLLQRDPDQGLAFLAQQFRPRDAKAILQSLSQQWGVDIQGLAAQAPWTDPAVQQLVEPLQRQIQEMNQREASRLYQQHQQAAQQVAGSIQAFATAKDENGDLKYPHFNRLQNTMAQIVNVRGVMPLETLYDAAVKLDPELFEELIENRARKAEAKALQDAAKKSAETEEAVRASRNVNGGTQAPKQRKRESLDEALHAVSKQLSR